MTERGRVLVVDDEANAREALAEILEDEGYETRSASDGRKALGLLGSFDPHVVVTDLKMPVLDGIGLLDAAKADANGTVFLVMTAFGSIETAVDAIKKGADNYLTKPLDLDALSVLMARALQTAKLRREAHELRRELHERFSFGNVVAGHPSMQRVMKMVAQVARSRATVLIQGESGTGKELIAAAIHHNSPRKDGPFVRLNCAALAETLLESELFGHERGAFTGATGRRDGRFSQADGGTLFLDEVSEIPASVQVKLLRFLQERQFERVGGNETLEVEVRVVAATNCPLPELVQRGLFREDLYYRLNVVQIDVPPLRERRSDIALLAHHFLDRYAQENDREIEGFTDDALRAIVAHAWPGNVRELENAIERAVVMSDGSRIRIDDLRGVAVENKNQSGFFVPGTKFSDLEKMAICETLEACNGSTKEAAEMLGISRRKIQYRLKEWGTTAEEVASGAYAAGGSG